MRNVRILVEFASVVMPGAILLLALTYFFAPTEWIEAGSYNTAGGIAAAIAISFAAGHLLQGLAQIVVEPIWRRWQRGGPAAWAVERFAGREADRFLTSPQLDQLELQFPLKLAVPFPAPAEAQQRTLLAATISHLEAYLQTAKVTESLDDLLTDLQFNRGLIAALLLIAGSAAISQHYWFALASLASATAAMLRIDFLYRKYIQSLFLLLLTTSIVRDGGGGKGGNGGGGGGGALPLPMARLGGGRAGAGHSPDDEQ